MSYSEKCAGGSAVHSCNCSCDRRGNPAGAQFQDRTYGPGLRVHTVGEKALRCTVCSAEKQLGKEGR